MRDVTFRAVRVLYDTPHRSSPYFVHVACKRAARLAWGCNLDET